MANDSKKPWGKVFAVLPRQSDPEKNDWIELGVAWMNQSESGQQYMRVELRVEPVQWRDPAQRRIIDIQKAQPRGESNANTQRGQRR